MQKNLRPQSDQKFGTRFEQALIKSVDFSSHPRRLISSEGTLLARSVIIATGASARMTGIPGEMELYGGKGVTTCATCVSWRFLQEDGGRSHRRRRQRGRRGASS